MNLIEKSNRLIKNAKRVEAQRYANKLNRFLARIFKQGEISMRSAAAAEARRMRISGCLPQIIVISSVLIALRILVQLDST